MAWCQCENGHTFKCDISWLVPKGSMVQFEDAQIEADPCPVCKLPGIVLHGQQYTVVDNKTYNTYLSPELKDTLSRLRSIAVNTKSDVPEDIKIKAALGEIAEFAPELTELAQAAAQRGGLRLLVVFIGYLIFLYSASANTNDDSQIIKNKAEAYITQPHDPASIDLDRYYRVALDEQTAESYDFTSEVQGTVVGISRGTRFSSGAAVASRGSAQAVSQSRKHTNGRSSAKITRSRSLSENSVASQPRRRDLVNQLTSAKTLADAHSADDSFLAAFRQRWPSLEEVAAFIEREGIGRIAVLLFLIGWVRRRRVSEFKSKIDWNLALDQCLVALTGKSSHPKRAKTANSKKSIAKQKNIRGRKTKKPRTLKKSSNPSGN